MLCFYSVSSITLRNKRTHLSHPLLIVFTKEVAGKFLGGGQIHEKVLWLLLRQLDKVPKIELCISHLSQSDLSLVRALA